MSRYIHLVDSRFRALSFVASSHFPSILGSFGAPHRRCSNLESKTSLTHEGHKTQATGHQLDSWAGSHLVVVVERNGGETEKKTKNAFQFPSSPPNAAQFSPPPPPPPARRRGGRGGGRAPDPNSLDSAAAVPNSLDSAAAIPDPTPLDSAAAVPDPHSLDPAAAPGEERDPLRAPPALRPPRGPLPLQRHRLLARRQRQPHRRPRGALQRALRVPHLLRSPRHGGPPLRLPHRHRRRPGPPLPLLVRRRARQGRPAPALALRLPRHRMDHAQAPRQRLPDPPRLRGLQEEVPPILCARHRRHMVPGLLCPILGDAEGL